MTVLARLRIPALVASFALLLVVAAAKANAAKPPLGPSGWPGELTYQPSARAVTILLFAAYGLGALAVLAGLRAPRIGGRWIGWVLLLAVVAVLVSPIGSGDHTNYAAYGRIAIQGGDPYTQSPAAWNGGLDPITSSVQPPWRETPSIYGPIGTALMALSSAVGGDDLRLTVTVWQIFVVLAWLGMRALLLRLADASERTRGRVDVLWTFNPIVFGVLVLGAHIDLIAAFFVVAALVVMREHPLPAGMLVGAAAGTKLTYAVVALGMIWAWRTAVVSHPGWASRARELGPLARLWRPLRTPEAWFQVRHLAAGALLVLVPSYLVAGPRSFTQLGAAGGSFSYATPAAPLWRGLRLLLPEWAVATIVFVLAAASMIGLAWLLLKVAAKVSLGRRIRDSTTRRAVVVTWALSTAYVLCAPYSLPWYDALTWALLPLFLEMAWDRVLVVRALAMALAYVPGRVLGLSPGVEAFTLNFRMNIAPVFTIATLLLIVVIGVRNLRPSARLPRPTRVPTRPSPRSRSTGAQRSGPPSRAPRRRSR